MNNDAANLVWSSESPQIFLVNNRQVQRITKDSIITAITMIIRNTSPY